MNNLLRCDTDVLNHILRLLSYNDIKLLQSSCPELSGIIDDYLQHVTEIRGCWKCAQEFTHIYPNIKEISLFIENEEFKYDGDNNFSFPDSVERLFIDKRTDTEIHMPIPKQLKVFHTGGIFLDQPIDCPDLEEFLCCETGSSPPIYEFNNATKIKRFVMDRCGDNGENPMEYIHESPIEILELGTVTDDSLMKMQNLKHLSCSGLDGSCFEKLRNLESISFGRNDTFNDEYLRHLNKLKALHFEQSDQLDIPIDVLKILQYVNPMLEHLSMDSYFLMEMNDEKLLELAEFITSRFTNLITFSVFDYNNKLKFFTDKITELNPKIRCCQQMQDFINSNMSQPSKNALVICDHCQNEHNNDDHEIGWYENI